MDELVVSRRRRAGRVSTGSRSGSSFERFPLAEPEPARSARAASSAYPGRLRGRLVPEGRRRDGRRPRAEADQRADVFVESLTRCATIAGALVLLTGPARGYVRRELERLGDPVRPSPLRPRGRLARSTTRGRLPRDLAPGRRPEGSARVDGDRRAARHDPRRPGAGARLRRRERRPGRRRRRGGARGRRSSASTPTRRSAAAAHGRAGTAERTPTNASLRAGRSSSTGSRTCGLIASAPPVRPRRCAVGPPARRRPRTAGPARLLRPRPASRRRRARRRRHGEVPAARRRAAEQPERLLAPLPRLDLLAARPAAAPLPRATRGIPVVVNQNGVAYPGWAGDGLGAEQRRFGVPLLAADHVLYQSEFCKRSADDSSASRAAPGRSSTTLSTSTASPRAGRPRRPGPPAWRRPDPGISPRARARLHTSRAASRRHAARDRPPRVRSGAALRRLGLEESVELVGRYTQREAPDVFRRAHVLLHTKVNDPCPTAVIEAMACGLPVVYAASGGRSSSSATRPASACRTPTAGPRRPADPEELARPCSRPRRPRALREAARRRAVERFALEPWLDRHAELFAELALRPARCPRSRPRRVAGVGTTRARISAHERDAGAAEGGPSSARSPRP